MAVRTTTGRQKPKRPWRIEPVPLETPDLAKLTQLLATMAIDRAKSDKPPVTRCQTQRSAVDQS